MTTQSLRIFEKYWKPGTSKVLTLSILVTLIFFGTFYYLYVSENYSYLVERNFRLLATWGKELTETFDNYERSFRFRVQEQESASLGESSDSSRSRRSHHTLTNEGLVLEGFAPNAETQAESASQNKSNYKLMLEQQTREQLSLLPFVKNVKPPKPAPQQATTAEAVPKDHPPTVTFSYSPNQPNGLVEAKANDQDGKVTATASIALGE
jgi:hypothetical protein